MLKYRISYTIALGVAALFYIFFTGYLSFFTLVLVALLSLISWIFTLLAIRKTRVQMEAKGFWANKEEDFTLHITMENRSIFPIARAQFEFYCENVLCGEKQRGTFFMSIGSRSEQVAEYRVQSRYCGKIAIVLTEVKYYDYLGVFSMKKKVNQSAEIFIMPHMHSLDLQIDTAGSPSMESNTYSKTKPGDDPSEIFKIRPFHSGDRLRSIHWKLSSKLDELMVKEFSLPTDSSILLLTELMASDMEALDTVVETLTSFAYFLLENQMKHRVAWYDAGHDWFHEEEIESEENLTALLNSLLSVRQYTDQPYALTCHNQVSDVTLRDYPHTIYITGQLTDSLISFFDRAEGKKTTVLYCGEMDEGQQKLADMLEDGAVIPIRSGEIQAGLSGITA